VAAAQAAAGAGANQRDVPMTDRVADLLVHAERTDTARDEQRHERG
jgi:hypothetical protein